MDTAEIKQKIKVFIPYLDLVAFNLKFNGTNTPKGTIQFDNICSKKPLPALVEANYLADFSAINVSVVVFIAAGIKPNITIQQLFAISNMGTYKLQFFIDYTYNEIRSKEFDIYELNFQAVQQNLPEGVFLEEIDTVEVFLVDTDPIGSRGTETSVQETSG